jgi:hypothetical protein
MIDWWVISSILAGLGTAYGANAYNKKDAKELREKAEKLLADSGFKEAETKWTTQVEELQKKLTQTDEDKQKAEEAKAKLEAMIQELQGNIQARRDDTQKQLQDITSPVESQFNMATPYDFGRALGYVDKALRDRGIVIGPALQDLFNRIATRSQPFERGTISQLHERATVAYAKDTAPPSGKGRRRRGRGKKRGGADTPAEAEAKKEALADIAPVREDSQAAEGLKSFLSDDEPPAAPPIAVPETPAAQISEAPVAPAGPPETTPPQPPAVTVVPLPPVAGTPPSFPTLEEFRAMWDQAFAEIARTPGMLPPMMGMPPGVPPPPMMGPPPIVPAPPPSKKDKEAQKAAVALAEKLTRARDAAFKEVAPYKDHAATLAAEAKQNAEAAYGMLSAVVAEIEALVPQLTQQEVREMNWSALKQSGANLNARLTGAVKAYKDAVGSLPSGFLSFFKKKEAAAPAVSTARHDTFVKETSDRITRLEGGVKELGKLEKAIRYQIDNFFNPPEQFRGGCTLVAKDAKLALDAMEASKQQITASAAALKDLKSEFKNYTTAAKGAQVADSVLPPVAPAIPGPPPLPPPAPLSEMERAAVKSRVEEIAAQTKQRQEAEAAAERATPVAWNPMIPLPSGPPPEGGALFSSPKVLTESPELATLYTSVMTKRADLEPVVVAYDRATALGQKVLTDLQDMHSKEKAFLRLTTKEAQAEERKSCGYIPEETPAASNLPALLSSFNATKRATQPPTGPELELAPLPAAPAAPGLAPLEVEAPAGDIPVMVGDPPLPPQLAQLAPLVPDDAANVSQRLLPTTKRPTKGSWWHENATAVRDLVGAWYDKWKRLPKEEKKASKNEAEAAQQALQLSASGSDQDQVVQLGGDSLEKEIDAELKALEGGAVRKRTFKRRRGEKQNGRRVSRRRKDSANRSHSHTR